MDKMCGMAESISKKCKHYKPKSFFNCEADKCYMIEKEGESIMKDNSFDKKAQREFIKAVAKAMKPLEKALKEFVKAISKIDWEKINENLRK